MNELEISVLFDPLESHSDTPNQSLVRNLFGLAPQTQTQILINNFKFNPNGITYITGFSGSGKSSLLKEINKQLPDAVTDLDFDIPSRAVIDCFKGDSKDIIQWVSRFGLGEAGVLVTNAQLLSEGQKERLKLAMLLWCKPSIIIIDEFLSKLDRLTARIISYQVQKIIREHRITAIFATAHNDLSDALLCDQIIELDFLGEISLLRPKWKEKKLAEGQELVVEEGTFEDFLQLKRFHYMDRQVGDNTIQDTASAITKVTYKNKTVGVRVYSKPYPTDFEKIKIFKMINEYISLSSRVIVHPSFRGMGVSKLLSFEPKGVRPIVCTHSALEHYFPFDIASGFKEKTHPSVLKTHAHIELETLIYNLGVDKIEDLNDINVNNKFLLNLSIEYKEKILSLVKEILSDYDFRITLYYLNILNTKIDKKTAISLKQFFIRQFKNTQYEDIPKLLSEALHFSMQGLVKNSFEYTKQGGQL